MMDIPAPTVAALGGLAGGIALGVTARWGRFCTLGAIEDAIFGSSMDRMRMWALAIAVACVGSFLIAATGLVDIDESFYLIAPASVSSTFVGAVMFGLGMAFVGTCGFGMLARIGGGDLKSIVTFLVMGVSAYATARGATGLIRIWAFSEPEIRSQPAGIAHTLSQVTGISQLIIAISISALLAIWALRSASLRANPGRLITALGVGLVIVWGWLVTGLIARNDFETTQLVSYTFSVPPGETLIYFMTMSGAQLNFGIGAVVGVVIGAFATALGKKEFRWEACDDDVELRRQMVGGFLMGTGSVLAQGCTVGQGLSAASLLAWTVPLALAGMFIGAWFGLQYLITGSVIEPVRALTTNWRNEGETG
ncbi:MAG: YeeE/YedE family protein [Rhizobiaceae bacterium]